MPNRIHYIAHEQTESARRLTIFCLRRKVMLSFMSMNKTTLYKNFSRGLGWNGIFYAIYKSLSTVISFLLYYKLSTGDFSLWATTNSSIYLVILWFDLGLSKSIPRYAPVFASNKKTHKSFIIIVCLLQAFLLLPGIPMLWYYMTSRTASLVLIALALGTFLAEGMVKMLRLTYHAQFHNKQFNLMNTITVLLETFFVLSALVFVGSSYNLLLSILISKLCCSTLLALAAGYGLPSLYKDKEYTENKDIDLNKTIKECASHSVIMGSTTVLTSLSERNFLIPLFTSAIGQEAANMFKIANDGALLFYRMIIKTIGTTDTALLAHIETMPNKKELLPDAFKKLSTQIASLCIPVLGVLALFLSNDMYKEYNPLVFKLFFIIAMSYMIESLFSMYERVLEVKRKYMMLAFSYLPYIAIVAGMFLVSFFGLVNSVLAVQGVRLVQVLLCIYCVRTYYGLQFPVRFVVRLSLLVAPVCIVA
ncbi:MAG: hypothetical protein M1114_01075, partial [Candidatus Dependentiae bacterium]|nr:hypothetical protein [Candidatus Dependentiae bacterium]